MRSGKGDKDRTTVLPAAVQEEEAARKERRREMHAEDRVAGLSGVALPNAFGRNDPRAGGKWPWRWLYAHVA